MFFLADDLGYAEVGCYGQKKNPDAPLILFDLEKDPGEKANVAAEHPDVVAALLRTLKAARSDSAEFPLFGARPMR